MDTKSNFKEAPANALERRRKPRYLFSVMMTIRSAGGVAMQGISIEMSEAVELEPIGGAVMPAVVRHKLGQLYGFEFIGLSAEQTTRVVEDCKKLGRYRSRARGA
jgi:hypothetical protein